MLSVNPTTHGLVIVKIDHAKWKKRCIYTQLFLKICDKVAVMNLGVLVMLHAKGRHVDERAHGERHMEGDDALNSRTKLVRNILFVGGSEGADGEESDVFKSESGMTVDQGYRGVGRND